MCWVGHTAQIEQKGYMTMAQYAMHTEFFRIHLTVDATSPTRISRLVAGGRLDYYGSSENVYPDKQDNNQCE